MKRFQYFLSIISAAFIFSTFTGCYTTFQTVRTAQAGEDYYPGQYDNDDYYYDEQQPYEAETTMQFAPSRLVAQKTYYDYGRYVRTVKYVTYRSDFDAWDDPWYSSTAYYNEPGISINIYFGGGDYYRWWRPVYWPTYPIAYYDPFWWDIVYYPVPIYYPGPVCWPGPIYNPGPIIGWPRPPYPHPHIGHDGGGSWAGKNKEKRDWDRRQPIQRPTVVRRPTGDVGTRQPTNSGDRGRIVSRPVGSTGTITTSGRSPQGNSTTGRRVVRPANNGTRQSGSNTGSTGIGREVQRTRNIKPAPAIEPPRTKTVQEAKRPQEGRRNIGRTPANNSRENETESSSTVQRRSSSAGTSSRVTSRKEANSGRSETQNQYSPMIRSRQTEKSITTSRTEEKSRSEQPRIYTQQRSRTPQYEAPKKAAPSRSSQPQSSRKSYSGSSNSSSRSSSGYRSNSSSSSKPSINRSGGSKSGSKSGGGSSSKKSSSRSSSTRGRR